MSAEPGVWTRCIPRAPYVRPGAVTLQPGLKETSSPPSTIARQFWLGSHCLSNDPGDNLSVSLQPHAIPHCSFVLISASTPSAHIPVCVFFSACVSFSFIGFSLAATCK